MGSSRNRYGCCVKNKIEWAECDVQLTNENTLLIIHDETLDRTSSVKGPINKVSKSELNNINVGKLSQKDFNFQKIPTLTELLTFCKKSKLNLNIEMKFYEPIETSYIKRLVKELLKNRNNKYQKSNFNNIFQYRCSKNTKKRVRKNSYRYFV